MPPTATEDAAPIAMAATNGVDYLVTWNFRHIVNAAMRSRIERVCRQATGTALSAAPARTPAATAGPTCGNVTPLTWEYKDKHADLDAAFNQLRQYALALENPPLLIVSDMARFRIRTNLTNSVSETHEFTLDDLFDAATRDKLKWAMSDPGRLQPGETRQTLTERAATTFATLAQSLRERGHEPAGGGAPRQRCQPSRPSNTWRRR